MSEFEKKPPVDEALRLDLEWTDDDDGALGRVIEALERIQSGMTVVSDDRLLANPNPRKMTIRDAQELAKMHIPTLRRIRQKLDPI
jgi:hypothetical protein